jgi:hypothetical protein
MDDETKSAVAKLVDKFTDVVGNVAAAASNAAQHAMESNARRMEPDAGWIAASAGEQIYFPETNDAAAIPAPLIPAIPGKSSGTPMGAPKKAKKAAKKAAGRNLAGKPPKRAKQTKPTTGRKAAGSKKNASKVAKKKKTKRA